MTQTQYLKMLELELHNINKIIDFKIIHNEDYSKEARDHKLILKKVRYHTRKSFWARFFPTFSNLVYKF